MQRMLAKEENSLKRDLSFLQQWMERPSMGCVYLIGADGDIYRNTDLSELIAFKRPNSNPLAARILGDGWVKFWHRRLGTKKKNEVQHQHL